MTSQVPLPEEIISKIKLFCAKRHPFVVDTLMPWSLYRNYSRQHTDKYETFHQYLMNETSFFSGGYTQARLIFQGRIEYEQKLREKKERRRQRKLRNN